jgi:hypothetical protein
MFSTPREPQVGDYDVRQFSMWDFPPDNSIVVYREVNNAFSGEITVCTFYVTQLVESKEGYKRYRTVDMAEGISPALQDFLSERGYKPKSTKVSP